MGIASPRLLRTLNVVRAERCAKHTQSKSTGRSTTCVSIAHSSVGSPTPSTINVRRQTGKAPHRFAISVSDNSGRAKAEREGARAPIPHSPRMWVGAANKPRRSTMVVPTSLRCSQADFQSFMRTLLKRAARHSSGWRVNLYHKRQVRAQTNNVGTSRYWYICKRQSIERIGRSRGECDVWSVDNELCVVDAKIFGLISTGYDSYRMNEWARERVCYCYYCWDL